MSEITTCPTCGSSVKVTLTPTLVNGPDDAAGKVCERHYEPLGLVALERAVVTTSIGVAYFEASLSENSNQPSVKQALKVAIKAWHIAIGQLLAARAAAKADPA